MGILLLLNWPLGGSVGQVQTSNLETADPGARAHTLLLHVEKSSGAAAVGGGKGFT